MWICKEREKAAWMWRWMCGCVGMKRMCATVSPSTHVDIPPRDGCEALKYSLRYECTALLSLTWDMMYCATVPIWEIYRKHSSRDECTALLSVTWEIYWKYSSRNECTVPYMGNTLERFVAR